MKQVVKKQTKPKSKKEKKSAVPNKTKSVQKSHPKYGTSKLEEDFARDFLDKLGLEYTYQFEAKDIGRFFDFYCQGVLIEIDGDYWHSNPLLYEESELNRTQKRAQKVDDYKNRWALLHGFPIVRIWEHDIRKNPKQVMDRLKEIFYIDNRKKTKDELIKRGNKQPKKEKRK